MMDQIQKGKKVHRKFCENSQASVAIVKMQKCLIEFSQKEFMLERIKEEVGRFILFYSNWCTFTTLYIQCLNFSKITNIQSLQIRYE